MIENNEELIVYTEVLEDREESLRENIDEIEALKATEINALEASLDEMVAKVGSLEHEKEVSETWYKVTGVVTSYSPYDNQSGIEADENPNVTSTGVAPGTGYFAVDPERIPYGSKIRIIYGDGTVEEGIAADTGGTMRNSKLYHVDVFRQTYEETLQFGLKTVTICWSPNEKFD